MPRFAPTSSRLLAAALCALFVCLGLGIFQPASATSDGNERPSSDELRQEHIQKQFDEIDRFKAMGRYDSVVWTLEEILSNARIRDRAGNANTVTTAKALAEMEMARAKLAEGLLPALSRMKSVPLAAIKSAPGNYFTRYGDVVDRVRIGSTRLKQAQLEVVAQAARLPKLEICLARHPVVAACLRDGSHAGAMETQLDALATRLRGAMDKACAAPDGDQARTRVAEARQSKAEMDGLGAKAQSWIERRAKTRAATCESADLDSEVNIQKETEANLAAYATSIDDFEPMRARIKSDLDQAITTAKADFDRLEQEARQLRATIDALRHAEMRLQSSSKEPTHWIEEKIDKLLTDGGSAFAVLEAYKRDLETNYSADRDAIRQARAQVAKAGKTLQRFNDAVSCADRIASMSAVRLAEADMRLEPASRCVQMAVARAAVAAHAAQANAASPAAAPPPSRQAAGTASPTPAPAPAPALSQIVTAQAAGAQPTAQPEVYGGLEIRGGKRTIGIGESVRFSATDMAGRPYAGVEWTSFEPDLLRLDQSGGATGLGPGTITLQVKIGEGLDARKAYLEVTVIDAPAVPPTSTARVPTAPTAGDRIPWDPGREEISEHKDKDGYGFSAQATTTRPAPHVSTGAAAPGTTGMSPGATSPGGSSVSSQDRAGVQPAQPSDGGFSDQGTQTRRVDSAPASTGGFVDRGTQSGEVVSILGESASLDQRPHEGGPLFERAQTGVAGAGGAGAGGAGPGAQGSGGGSGPGGGSGTQPNQPTTFLRQGQPAASHIYSAASRLGWAGGLARYSVGPADASIDEHLRMAGEHVAWANRTSFAPLKAWPNWQGIKGDFSSWSEQLARNRSNNYRRSLAGTIDSRHQGLASEIEVQYVGQQVQTANCDAAYFRLGYALAYASQALGIADEAARNGDKAATEKARADALQHLRNASLILSRYDQIRVASGRCADFTGIPDMLRKVSTEKDITHQAFAASRLWETVAQRIDRLSNLPPQQMAQPPAPAVPPRAQRPPPAPAAAPGRPRSDGYYLAKGRAGPTGFHLALRFLGPGTVRVATLATLDPLTLDQSGNLTSMAVPGAADELTRCRLWALQEPRFVTRCNSNFRQSESFDTTYTQSGNQLAVTLAQDRRSNDTFKQRWCGDLVLAMQDGGRRMTARYTCRGFGRGFEAELEFAPHGW